MTKEELEQYKHDCELALTHLSYDENGHFIEGLRPQINMLERLIDDYFEVKEEVQTLLDTQDTLVKRAKELQWYKNNAYMITRKLYDDLVDRYDKLEKALDKACEEIARHSGSCPLDIYDVNLDCDNKCENQCSECWKEWCLK